MEDRNLTASVSSKVVQQVAGAHYTGTGACPHCGGVIQHWDLYASAPYLEGCATKYLTRWRDKGGLEDLLKARSYVDKLIVLATPVEQAPVVSTCKTRITDKTDAYDERTTPLRRASCPHTQIHSKGDLGDFCDACGAPV